MPRKFILTHLDLLRFFSVCFTSSQITSLQLLRNSCFSPTLISQFFSTIWIFATFYVRFNTVLTITIWLFSSHNLNAKMWLLFTRGLKEIFLISKKAVEFDNWRQFLLIFSQTDRATNDSSNFSKTFTKIKGKTGLSEIYPSFFDLLKLFSSYLCQNKYV